MSFDETINAYFVTTGNNGTSEEFGMALTYLRNHISSEHIRQIKASEGFPLIASGQLTKKDVFVLDRFEGDFFQQLQQTRSLIVGPRCLITCLLKCEPIPLGTSPVFNTAMRNLQISATGITPQEKEQLRVLIQWMGGHYFQNFGLSVTHLISNTIKSTKYEHATLNGIPVMHVDWVQRVWERSSVDDVSASDAEFSKYRLPIFFGTNITCTGLSTEKKNEINRLVNENGGTYHRAFRSGQVDIVITEKTETNSEKYKAAVRYKKDILQPEWILDSVQRGFALPTKTYQIKSLKVSTPTKGDQSIADFTSTDHTRLSDISRISTAGGRRANDLTTINDTIYSTAGVPDTSCAFVTPATVQSGTPGTRKATAAAGTDYRAIFNEICPKLAKKAGTFLDGCCIYLSGFRQEEKEKLNRILNLGGATRYDELNEKITHIIIGQLDDTEFRSWKRSIVPNSVHVVRLDWLWESIKLKQLANEALYRVLLPPLLEPNAPSPSSKKTLRSMNHSFKQPDIPIKKKLFDQSADDTLRSGAEPILTVPRASSTEYALDDEEQNLIAQYSEEHMQMQPIPVAASAEHGTSNVTLGNPADSVAQPAGPAAPRTHPSMSDTTSSAVTTIDYEHLDFFHGSTIYIDKEHFPEEFYTQMISECEAAQGNVVQASYVDTVDYAIVSFERTFDTSTLPLNARHIVTELYVETCMKQNQLVPIQYYHKHVPHTAEARPLEAMTIVISLYAELEKDFIDSLARLLGARLNNTFAKKEKPLLVCPTPSGSKYEGALKWRYPVVTSEWLVECAVKGVKLPYQPYLVGNSPPEFPVTPTHREETKQCTPARNVVPRTAAAIDADMTENYHQESPHSTAAHAPNFTPLRNKRVSELAGPAKSCRMSPVNAEKPASASASPHTPPTNYAHPTYNFDFLEGMLAEIENEQERECLREVVMEMRNNQTPELERIRRQACTPINRKLPTPKGIPEFCTTPEFEKRMADEFERRWRLPVKKMKPDTPIEEIRRRVLWETCKALGIPVTEDEPEKTMAMACTKNATPRIGNKSQTYVASDTPVLHTASLAPRAIFTSQSPNTSNASTGDTTVPATQSPSDTANREVSNRSGLGRHASLVGKSTINFDKISFEETELNAGPTATPKRSQANTTPSREVIQITEYLKHCESRRQSINRAASLSDTQQENVHGVQGGEAHYVQPFESEQFGLGTEQMVGWRDPVEFGKDRRSKLAPPMQHNGKPCFSISCTNEAREEIIAKIYKLGGEVSKNMLNFDNQCTHFVCERPNRAEKMFGCISSGKWVLSLRYVEECYAKDMFIDEELYEWGNCKALNMPQLTQDEQIIAAAAHRWRKQLRAVKNESSGAFKGFRVILRITERNLDRLKAVIKAGNGEVIDATSPYGEHNGAHLATHCCIDVKNAPINKIDYNFLRSRNVKIYSQMFINSYLMNGSGADFSKYEINM